MSSKFRFLRSRSVFWWNWWNWWNCAGRGAPMWDRSVGPVGPMFDLLMLPGSKATGFHRSTGQSHQNQQNCLQYHQFHRSPGSATVLTQE